MSERTLVPIFVLWAVLTIVTPTLILLSENSKADLDLNGNTTEAMKVRRMIGYTENHVIRTPPAEATTVVVEDELALAPAPVSLTDSHSHNNHTLIRNSTDDGLTLSSSEVHIKQTDIR